MQDIFEIKDFVHHYKTQNLRFPGLINPDDICWMKITRISQNLRFIHYLKPEVLGVNCYYQYGSIPTSYISARKLQVLGYAKLHQD